MRIVILTGAGISAESGIKTFRGADGLWEGHRIEDVASPDGFHRDPKTVYRFYNERRRQLVSPDIQPNAAHHALVRLEQKLGDDFLLVTQNIDDLHQRAGNKNVLPMHGELRRARCQKCGDIPAWDHDFDDQSICTSCDTAGGLRPHVVWFGEMPLYMDEITEALFNCDLFLSVGTSGHVYPAAGFVEMAGHNGAQTIEMNLEPSNRHSAFDEKVYGSATETVTQWVDQFLKDH